LQYPLASQKSTPIDARVQLRVVLAIAGVRMVIIAIAEVVWFVDVTHRFFLKEDVDDVFWGNSQRKEDEMR
jgi:hypothetical protein